MEYIIKKSKNLIEKLVDKYNGKIVDTICFAIYIILGILSIFIGAELISIAKTPVIKRIISPYIYALLVLAPTLVFYLSMAGNKLQKPSERLKQFIFVFITTVIFALSYITQLTNITSLNILLGMDNIEVIPYNLIEGNIRFITTLIPLVFILPAVILAAKIVANEESRKEIAEYKLEILTPTAFKSDDTTIDIKICEDLYTGEDCIVPEKKLYEHTFISGSSGSGKTATVLLPMIDQLMAKKNYLRNEQKRLAFEALKENIAQLKAPLSNEYINENFSMEFIEAIPGKEFEFKKKFENQIIGTRENEDNKTIYKGLGLTVIAPDGGLAKNTIEIAEGYGAIIHKIDPKQEEIQKGVIARFNPLKGDRPEKTGDIVSSILVSMEKTDGEKSNSYFTDAGVRAIRNLVILLKVMFPKIKGEDPKLTDILEHLNDFRKAVEVTEQMKKDPVLKERWSSVISYFEASFYPPPVDSAGKVILGQTQGSQRRKTEEALGGTINQLDNFLGREEIRYILCPPDEESIVLKEVLEKGECIAIATRQNELGQKLGKAFAMFFILSLQNEILSRYAEDENPEVPHFLIIDEFPFYLNDNTKVFFTFARKYRCGVSIAIQNRGQLREVSKEFGEIIFANTSTKIVLPGANVEDRQYWSEFFGTKEAFLYQTGISTSSMFADNPSYMEQKRGSLVEKEAISTQDINSLEFKQIFYSYTDKKGKQKIGKGRTDFLEKKKKEEIETKKYDFSSFKAKEPEQEKIKVAEEIKEDIKIEMIKEKEIPLEKITEFEARPEIASYEKESPEEITSDENCPEEKAPAEQKVQIGQGSEKLLSKEEQRKALLGEKEILFETINESKEENEVYEQEKPEKNEEIDADKLNIDVDIQTGKGKEKMLSKKEQRKALLENINELEL